MEEPPLASSPTDGATTTQPSPDPAVTVPPFLAPASGEGTAVVGGGTFGDAPTLTAGTYSDAIMDAEQVFYKVRLDWGQRAAFTVDVPAPGTPITGADSFTYIQFRVQSWNPAREELSRSGGSTPRSADSISRNNRATVLGEYTPTIAYPNRTALQPWKSGYAHLDEASVAGYHYFAVSRRNSGRVTQPLPLRIRVAVEGTPQSAPSYATFPGADAAGPRGGAQPTPTTGATSENTEASRASASTGGGSSLPWVGGGLVLLAALAGSGYLVARRRSTSDKPG